MLISNMSYKKLNGPQILSNLLPNDAKKLLKNRGFFELELLSNWEKIVGTSFNKLSYPTKIKTTNSSPKGKGKLVVKVDRSVSFAFEHEHKKIVDKINLCFGYNAVEKIEIIQINLKNKKSRKDINFNQLDSEIKEKNKTYEELSDFPELKKSFEKIASKISKTKF